MATLSTNEIKIRYDIDLTKLQQATSEFDKITAEERALLAELGKLKKQFDDVGEKAKKAGKDAGDSMGSLGQVVGKIGPIIAGVFAADSIMGFAKQVIAVTAEFQKLGAVLKNTLGSNSAAQGAMSRIQEFAAQTPFSVQEITQNFVKLANRGIIPTNKELTSLGDLASALGKDMNQVVEAVLDVSNTERWNELGIKVKANGDKMTGTFKGVTVEMDRTEKGALKMIEAFGGLQGVSGSMAAVSQTIGGQISNLGDAWDSLLNTIGTNLAPIYQKALGATSAFLNNLNDLFGGKQVKEAGEQYNKIYEKFSKASPEALANLRANTAAQIKAQQQRLDALKKTYGDETRQNQIIREEYRAAASEYDDIQQESITSSRTVSASQIADQERLLKAYQLNLDVFNALYESKKKTIKSSEDQTKANKEEYNARMKLLELERQQLTLMAQLRDSKLGELGAEKTFAEKVFALKKEFSNKGIGISENEVKVAELTADVKAKAYEEGAKKEMLATKGNERIFQEARDAADKRDKKFLDDGMARMKNYSDEYEANLKRQIEDEKEAAKTKEEIRAKTFEIGQTLTQGAFDLYQTNLSNEMSALQKRYDEEIRLADGNQQKIDELTQKKNEKEREIKIKQFRADQMAATARVIFSTAEQLMSSALNPALIPYIIGLSAAQLGLIAAQPVPEFAEGTKGKPFEGGRAIVGERGVEKVVTESGKVYFTPPTATLVDLPKGSQVIPNHALSKQELFLANHYANRSSSGSSPVVGKLDELSGILKSLPITQLNMDERGFEKFIRTPRRTTKILNNRFRSSSS